MAEPAFKFNDWDSLASVFGGNTDSPDLFGKGLFENGLPSDNAGDIDQFTKDQLAIQQGKLPGVNTENVDLSKYKKPDDQYMSLGVIPGLIDRVGNLFSNGLDPTGGSTALREQAELANKQAANERMNEQRERQIANRDYRVEAEKNAASEAAFKNAQQIQNMGASTGNAAAALARKVGNPDYNTQMARQDQSRTRAAQYQREGSRMDQEAVRRRASADMYDYAYNDMRSRNNKAAALAAGNTGGSVRPNIKDTVLNWFKNKGKKSNTDVPGDNGTGEQVYVDDDQTSPDNNGEIGVSDDDTRQAKGTGTQNTSTQNTAGGQLYNGLNGVNRTLERDNRNNFVTQTPSGQYVRIDYPTDAEKDDLFIREDKVDADAAGRKETAPTSPDNNGTVPVSSKALTPPPAMPTNIYKENKQKEALSRVSSNGQVKSAADIQYLPKDDRYWYYTDAKGNFSAFMDPHGGKMTVTGKKIGTESIGGR